MAMSRRSVATKYADEIGLGEHGRRHAAEAGDRGEELGLGQVRDRVDGVRQARPVAPARDEQGRWQAGGDELVGQLPCDEGAEAVAEQRIARRAASGGDRALAVRGDELGHRRRGRFAAARSTAGGLERDDLRDAAELLGPAAEGGGRPAGMRQAQNHHGENFSCRKSH